MVERFKSRLSNGRPGFDSRNGLPHIMHFSIVYIHCIHRSRVSELYSGHVKESGWLLWNSMSFCILFLSLFSFLYARYMCAYNDLNNLYIAKRSYNSNSSFTISFMPVQMYYTNSRTCTHLGSAIFNSDEFL